MARARRRDDAAVTALYRRALPMIYRYVIARLGADEAGEDAVAEVFLDMVVGIENVRTDHEAGFYTWLLQIAHAKVARALQKRATHNLRYLSTSALQAAEDMPAHDPADTTLHGNPQAIQELNETMVELCLALNVLTQTQRIVIIGRFLLGKNIEELARELNKQPGAIRALQFRALELLAKHMGVRRQSPEDGRRRGRT